MCLAAFAVDASDAFALVVAANRDESHLRPTADANWWSEPDGILGGRDLEAGGSWLAVDRRGRLAAVTNQPAPRGSAYTGSRGRLVSDYLAGRRSPGEFCGRRAGESASYGPYNLLLFDGEGLFHSVNRSPAERLAAGVHVLSNAPLGTPWPKVTFAASRLAACLDAARRPEDLAGQLFEMLQTRQVRGEATQGAALHWRTQTVFVRDDRYGTRSATVVLMSRDGEVTFSERRFGADGRLQGESSFRFRPVRAGGPQASR